MLMLVNFNKLKVGIGCRIINLVPNNISTPILTTLYRFLYLELVCLLVSLSVCVQEPSKQLNRFGSNFVT